MQDGTHTDAARRADGIMSAARRADGIMSAARRADGIMSAARIIIVGTSGSGKTTLARALSEITAAPHIEMDALYWLPDWQHCDDDEYARRLLEATDAPRWIADGNYRLAREVIWPRADGVIWLDLPLRTKLLRITRRTLRRSLRKEELWSGNRERLVSLLGLKKEDLIRWTLGAHFRHRKMYPAMFAEPRYAGLSVAHVRTTRGVERLRAAFVAAYAAPQRATD